MGVHRRKHLAAVAVLVAAAIGISAGLAEASTGSATSGTCASVTTSLYLPAGGVVACGTNGGGTFIP